MSWESSGCSATSKMNLELLQGTRQDLWPRGIHKSKAWILKKTFAPLTRLESICILLAYSTHHDFKLYQMDVKNAFFNRSIKEEVCGATTRL
jgi:hypothetical protein